MTALDDLTRKMFEIHEDSVKHITGLQALNSNVSTLGRAFMRIYGVGIDAVNAIIKAITMLGRRMQGLFLTSFARDLMPTLPPILDAWNTEIEEAVVSSLEPLKLSILWRLTPPTDAIAEAMRGLAEGPRKLSIPPYEGIPTIPSVPLVTPPPTQVMKTINDYVGRISEIEYKFFEAAPATAIRVGIDYGGVRRRATRGVFDAVRRGVKEAYGAKALAATPPQLEAAETIRGISDRFVAPASVLAYPVTRARRYVADVSKVDRIAQPVTKEVSEVYDARVLETVSKVHEVSKSARRVLVPPDMHMRPAMEIAKAAGLILTIPDMEKSLQPITTGEAKPYVIRLPIIGLPAIGPPPKEIAAERVAEAPVRVIVKYAPQIKSIGMLSRDTAKLVADMHAIKLPSIETGLVDAFLEVKEKDLDRVSQGMSEVYRAAAPVAWTPSIRKAAKIVSDHIERISSMALKKAEPYRLGVSRVPSVTEAMEAALSIPSVSESTKVPSLRTPVAEKAVGSKLVLVVPEVEKFSQLVAEKIAETYRHGVINRISLPVEAVADRVAQVSGFGTRARAPDRGFDLVEAGVKEPSVQVPSVVHPPSTLKIVGIGTPPVAVSEMNQAFYASGIILKDFMAKASSFGIIEAKQRYLAVGAMEAARSLSGAIPRVSGQFSRMMEEKYLEMARDLGMARALAVEQYFAAGSRLEIVPELNRDFNLMKRGVRDLSIAALGVASLSSTPKVRNTVNNHVVAMPDMSRSLAASNNLSKNFTDYKVEIEKAVKSYVGKMLVTLSRVPVEKDNLKRVPLEAPMSVPTVKLQEIIPLLSSMPAPSVVRPSLTPKAVNIVETSIVAMPEMSRALAASSALSRNFMGYEVEMEKAIKSYVRGMLATLPHVPVEKDNLERIPLEAPVNVPSVKLQEIVPILSSMQTSTRRETPKATQRSRPVAQPRSITVNVEPLKGESDLRELRRKIVQILREEARRHGVF